jgi:hypothetical protein
MVPFLACILSGHTAAAEPPPLCHETEAVYEEEIYLGLLRTAQMSRPLRRAGFYRTASDVDALPRSCLSVADLTLVGTAALMEARWLASCPAGSRRLLRSMHRLWSPLAQIDRRRGWSVAWLHRGEPTFDEDGSVSDALSHAAWAVRASCSPWWWEKR